MLTRMYADKDVTDPVCVLCKYQQSSCSCTHHSLGLESPSHQPLHAPTRDSDGPGQTEAIMTHTTLTNESHGVIRDHSSRPNTLDTMYDTVHEQNKSDFERFCIHHAPPHQARPSQLPVPVPVLRVLVLNSESLTRPNSPACRAGILSPSPKRFFKLPAMRCDAPKQSPHSTVVLC